MLFTALILVFLRDCEHNSFGVRIDHLGIGTTAKVGGDVSRLD